MIPAPRSPNFTADDLDYVEAAAAAFGAKSVRDYLLRLVHAEVLHACPRTLTPEGCTYHNQGNHR